VAQWEPETLWLQIADDFRVNVPMVNQSKILALLTALTTDLFYRSPETCSYVCTSLCGDPPNFQVFDPPSLEQLAWGITEVLLNDSDTLKPKPELFSTEVRSFIGVMLAYYGIEDPPDVLSVAIPTTKSSNELIGDEDDPDIIGAVWQKNKDAADQIREYIAANLLLLIEQLHTTPFLNRDDKSWKHFYQQASQFLSSLKQEGTAGTVPQL